MKRAALIPLAATLYLVAAWMVAPGFYDGFGPLAPYNWTCPPQQAGANTKPSSGHVDIKVTNGTSESASAFTDDGQIAIGFLSGAFDATGKTSISVDVAPTTSCPQTKGIQFVTNVYQITATAPLVKGSNLVLFYSALEAAPTDVYFATDPAGPWKSIGANQQARPYTIDTQTTSLGYFAAGLASSSTSPGSGSGGGGLQLLPTIVAALIVLVVLAGLPLAVIRRRRGVNQDEESEERED